MLSLIAATFSSTKAVSDAVELGKSRHCSNANPIFPNPKVTFGAMKYGKYHYSTKGGTHTAPQAVVAASPVLSSAS